MGKRYTIRCDTIENRGYLYVWMYLCHLYFGLTFFVCLVGNPIPYFTKQICLSINILTCIIQENVIVE